MRKHWILYALLIPPLVIALLAAVAGLRLWNGGRLVAQAQSQPVAALTDLGETQTLTILPLVEAEATAGLATVHGVSYLVRTDTATILLDFGMASGDGPSALESNLVALGISLESVDSFVISHPHPDHRGGGRNWVSGTFGTGSRQPDLQGKPVWVPVAMDYPDAQPQVSQDAVILAKGVATSGLVTYQEVYPLTLIHATNPEQALLVNVADHGVVLITGCGHPGLEALIHRAESVTGQKIIGVVGGLHYGDADAASLQQHIAFLAQRDPQLVALSPHDSGPAALDAFRAAFPAAYHDVKVGSLITFPADATVDAGKSSQ